MKYKGGCACGTVRYELTAAPLIVQACHCRDCQRTSGSAFVINMWIEREFVKANTTRLKSCKLEAGSGKTHEVFFCGKCGTYLWSRYYAVPGDTVFVRAGTLDDPSTVKPAVHIHTRRKVPWFVLPGSVPAFKRFYDMKRLWSPESYRRFRENIAKGGEA